MKFLLILMIILLSGCSTPEEKIAEQLFGTWEKITVYDFSEMNKRTIENNQIARRYGYNDMVGDTTTSYADTTYITYTSDYSALFTMGDSILDMSGTFEDSVTIEWTINNNHEFCMLTFFWESLAHTNCQSLTIDTLIRLSDNEMIRTLQIGEHSEPPNWLYSLPARYVNRRIVSRPTTE